MHSLRLSPLGPGSAPAVVPAPSHAGSLENAGNRCWVLGTELAFMLVPPKAFPGLPRQRLRVRLLSPCCNLPFPPRKGGAAAAATCPAAAWFVQRARQTRAVASARRGSPRLPRSVFSSR